MAALQYADVPGYAAILFRRTYTDLSLPGALMDRAAAWLSGRARWNGVDKSWTFPSGATLTFGYLQSEADRYRYQSAEFQFIGFDELTQFPESSYLYLFSRLRRGANVNVPLRMRSASNPGGLGHSWVKERFVSEPGPRVFVPARLDDNPHLDRESYLRSLAELDPVTRAQLLEGDWEARPGAFFRREWFPVVDAAPAGLTQVRYWDLAATEPKEATDPDWTAGALMGKSPEGVYYLLDMRRTRATPHAVEALVRQTAELDGKAVPVWVEQEPGSSGVALIDTYVRKVLPGWACRGDKVTGDKVTRASPFASQAEAGNVRLVRGSWVKAFLDEAEVFPQGAHDDQVDAASGAFNKIAGGPYRRLNAWVL